MTIFRAVIPSSRGHLSDSPIFLRCGCPLPTLEAESVFHLGPFGTMSVSPNCWTLPFLKRVGSTECPSQASCGLRFTCKSSICHAKSSIFQFQPPKNDSTAISSGSNVHSERVRSHLDRLRNFHSTFNYDFMIRYMME